MKTSQILASLFFGSLAAAVPINQRDLVTKTEMVMETVVVYTTVWDDEPVAEATTTAAAFYEQPSSAVEAKPTTTPAPTPAAVQTPVSVFTPPVQTPSPKPAPVSSAAPKVEAPKVEAPKVETPKPEAPKPTVQAAPKPETTAAPAPETTAAPAPKPEPTTQAAPAPATPSPAAEKASYGSSGSSVGDFSGDITIYQTQGGYGACGTQLNDSDMIVALAQPAWGASTYDVMTGEASNPWCGQEVEVHYKGNSIKAKIMDMCPGCTGHDIDLSPAAWKALTGSDEMTRYQATWSKIS